MSKSFNTNLKVYRSLGSEVTVESDQQKRRAWCVWLCSTPEEMEVPYISISNTYYGDVEPGPHQVLVEYTKGRTCLNESSCSLREFAVGGSLEVDTEGRPTGGEGVPFDLVGVVARHTVRLEDGTVIVTVTSAGDHQN